ncbi:CD63 antigen [Carcharodon carcharias]|uniref:CD63 antigen n=1 Tax=Carcharodon carcharias TaxID=13397 RepID=UPI001B7E6020|nr:CD63 antigen [Carcharodon carcharias]XP_041036283.1 CD63 antigen [Carcharodon carcharias]
MAVEGGMKCVKYLIFIFNFLFWISGIALIVVGILVQTKMNGTLHITSVAASGAPIVIIIVGVVINFVAFFGCCGAWKENYCMVTTFAVLLLLIFIVEIAAAIAGYVFKDQIRGVFEKSFNATMQHYNTSDNARNIDSLQEQFHCCGSAYYTDWFPHKVPDSCCKIRTHNCGFNVTAGNIYQEGCVNVINDWLKNNIVIVAGVALGIALFQLLGIIFACVLMKGIRSGYEVM